MQIFKINKKMNSRLILIILNSIFFSIIKTGCPPETQKCIPANKLNDFRTFLKAYDAFAAYTEPYLGRDQKIIYDQLKHEPIAKNYAINQKTKKIEPIDPKNDPKIYKNLETHFSFPTGKSMFPNNTVDCLSFDKLMNDIKTNPGLRKFINNPEDMHRIIFEKSCLPDFNKLINRMRPYQTLEINLQNIIFKLGLKNIYYTFDELKKRGYSPEMLVRIMKILPRGAKITTDTTTKKFIVKDSKGTIINVPPYDINSFPKPPLMNIQEFGPKNEIKLPISNNNFIAIDLIKLTNYVKCLRKYLRDHKCKQ